MPRTVRHRFLAAAALAVAAACSDSYGGGPPATSASLAGNYVLTAYTQGAVSIPVPATASGTLRLTAARYALSLTVGQPPQFIADSGSYTASATTWQQRSDNPATGTSTGTWTTVGADLTLDLTSSTGQRTVSTWRRQ